MANPCRIIPVNVFDFATLTTTIAPYAGMPVTNMKLVRRGRPARWPAASGTQSVKGTWNGQGYQVGGFGLDRFNLEPSALVRFRGFQNADWTGTTLVDTGSVAPYNAGALGSFTWGLDPLGSSIYDGYRGYKFFNKWFSKATIASFQIDITDTGNSWQYIDVSRAVLGDYIETTYNADFGINGAWDERTEQEQNDGGSTISHSRVPNRDKSGTFNFLSPAERQSMFDFVRYVGKRLPFAITFQAGEGASFERDFTFLQAKFTQLPKLAWTESLQHSMPFAIIEA